jgi:PII-like signaling protein
MRIDRELGKEGFQRINFLETKSDLPIIVEVLHRVNSFSKFHKPVEYVDLGELVML